MSTTTFKQRLTHAIDVLGLFMLSTAVGIAAGLAVYTAMDTVFVARRTSEQTVGIEQRLARLEEQLVELPSGGVLHVRPFGEAWTLPTADRRGGEPEARR